MISAYRGLHVHLYVLLFSLCINLQTSGGQEVLSNGRPAEKGSPQFNHLVGHRTKMQFIRHLRYGCLPRQALVTELPSKLTPEIFLEIMRDIKAGLQNIGKLKGGKQMPIRKSEE